MPVARVGAVPVARAGASRFAGLAPATGTAGTTETTGIVPGRCFALGLGNTGTTRILRVALADHGQSMQRARRPLSQFLRSSQWPGAQAFPLHGPLAKRGSMACHFPAVSVVPVVPARPLENGNSSRAVRPLPVAHLSGGPPTPSGTLAAPKFTFLHLPPCRPQDYLINYTP